VSPTKNDAEQFKHEFPTKQSNAPNERLWWYAKHGWILALTSLERIGE
jgi:hypothetical protein